MNNGYTSENGSKSKILKQAFVLIVIFVLILIVAIYFQSINRSDTVYQEEYFEPENESDFELEGINQTAAVGNLQEGDTIGEQRTAVILLKFSDKPAYATWDFRTPAEYNEAIFTGEHSTNAALKEMSYNKAWLTGQVFGWYTVDNSHECGLGEVRDLLRYAPDVDPTKFDRFIFIVYDSNCPTWGGASSFGKNNVTTDSGTIRASWSMIRDLTLVFPYYQSSLLNNSTILHELIHQFGQAGHANFLRCEGGITSSPSGACVQYSYGNPFDIMGSREYGDHISSSIKELFGWISPNEIQKITQSGEYEISPIETAPGGKVVAFKYDLPNPINVPAANENVIPQIKSYYFEYRIPFGFDTNLGDHLLSFANEIYHVAAIDNVGLQVYGVLYNPDTGYPSTTYLLDMKPGSAYKQITARDDRYDSVDSFLNVGKTFTDSANNLSVTVTEKLPDGRLKVKFGMGTTSNEPSGLPNSKDPSSENPIKTYVEKSGTIDITNPTKGGIYSLGSSVVVSWTPPAEVRLINIYAKDVETGKTALIASGVPNNGSYSWTVGYLAPNSKGVTFSSGKQYQISLIARSSTALLRGFSGGFLVKQ